MERCFPTRLAVLLLLLFASSPSSTSAQSPDDADWILRGLGTPSLLRFLPSNTLLVGTRLGILATLDATTGDILWRRAPASHLAATLSAPGSPHPPTPNTHHPHPATPITHAEHACPSGKSSCLAVVQHDGPAGDVVLRAVWIGDGVLAWEASLCGRGGAGDGPRYVDWVVDRSGMVWTLDCAGDVHARDVATGRIVRTTDLEVDRAAPQHRDAVRAAEAMRFRGIVVGGAGEGVLVAEWDEGGSDGRLRRLETVADADVEYYAREKLVPPLLVGTDVVGEVRCVVTAGGIDEEQVRHGGCPSVKVVVDDETTLEGRIAKNSKVLRVDGDAASAVFVRDTEDENQPTVAVVEDPWTLVGVETIRSAVDGDKVWFEMRSVSREHHDLKFSISRDPVVVSYSVEKAELTDDGDILVLTTKSANVLAISIGTCRSENTLEAQVLWSRHEALAEVVALKFSGPKNDDASSESDSSVLERVVARAGILLDFFMSGFDDKEGTFIWHGSHEERIMVVLTSAGVVYGLPTTGKGVPLWSVPLSSSSDSNVALSTQMYKNSDNTVTLVTHLKDNSSRILMIDSRTGQTKFSTALQTVASMVFAAGVDDVDFLAIMDTDAGLHFIPEDTGDRVSLDGKVWLRAKPNSDTLSGLLTSPNARLREHWSFAFPDAQVLDSIAVLPNEGPLMSSPARVLANRSTILKYENANSVMAITRTTPDSSDTGIGVYILDGETGDVVDSVFHPGTSGPVASVMCENWVAYSLWRPNSLRSEIHVTELFARHTDPGWLVAGIKNAARRWLRMTSGGTSYKDTLHRGSKSIGRADEEDNFTRAKALVGDVRRTSFIVDDPITTMAVTTTRMGITMKAVLTGLASGRIVTISRFFLDPRRSRSVPPSKKGAEMLPPYKAYIGTMNPGNDLVIDSSLAQLRAIVTAPVTDRESGSHVAAYGVDLFYTIAYPAGKFDTLSTDFNAAGLILTLGILIVGLGFTTHAVNRRVNRRLFI